MRRGRSSPSYLDEQGVDTPSGNAHWSKTGVSGLVKNPVYLGQARSGSIVKEGAHEALVTRAEFDAAQSVTKSLLAAAGRVGRVARRCSAGSSRCAGCGAHAEDHGQHRPQARRALPDLLLHRPLRDRASAPLAPSVRASLLDAYVEARGARGAREEDGLLAEAVDASEALEDAARAVADAEHELDLFVANPKLLTPDR